MPDEETETTSRPSFIQLALLAVLILILVTMVIILLQGGRRTTASYSWDEIDWSYYEAGFGDEFRLNESDPEPTMWYFVIHEYNYDIETDTLGEYVGIRAIEFENWCYPVSDERIPDVEQGNILTLFSPDEELLQSEVSNEARPFIRDLFSLGDVEVEFIELDYSFRVFFLDAITEDNVSGYTAKVYESMVESGWCTSHKGGGSTA